MQRRAFQEQSYGFGTNQNPNGHRVETLTMPTKYEKLPPLTFLPWNPAKSCNLRLHHRPNALVDSCGQHLNPRHNVRLKNGVKLRVREGQRQTAFSPMRTIRPPRLGREEHGVTGTAARGSGSRLRLLTLRAPKTGRRSRNLGHVREVGGTKSLGVPVRSRRREQQQVQIKARSEVLVHSPVTTGFVQHVATGKFLPA